MAMEFNKRNPDLLISSDQAYRLRHKHPDLKNQPLMKASSNVSPTKRSEHIKKQLSFLDNKMKCIGPLDQASKQQQSRYQHYLNQFRALQQTLSHLSTLEPVSEQAPLETERDGAVLSNLSGEHLSQGLPSEATSSQNIFNVLTDFDQLSGQLAMPESPSISDVDSLAVFALLNDGDEVMGGRS